MVKKFLLTVLGFILTSTIFISSAQNNGGFGDTRGVEGADLPGTDNAQEGGSEDFIDVVQNFVNYILGLMGLIALVVLLWGGFLMVTAAGDDERYKKGFTILKQAGIGLLFIGVSWFIVSLIFTVIGISTDV